MGCWASRAVAPLPPEVCKVRSNKGLGLDFGAGTVGERVAWCRAGGVAAWARTAGDGLVLALPGRLVRLRFTVCPPPP